MCVHFDGPPTLKEASFVSEWTVEEKQRTVYLEISLLEQGLRTALA